MRTPLDNLQEEDGMGADILWHNSSTNETQIWFMNGPQLTGRTPVVAENGKAIFVGPPWKIVATGDLHLRGADIVWHNDVSSETQIWEMEGRRVSGRRTVADQNGPIFVGSPWNIVGTGRFGEGSDNDTGIVWYNSATGETQVWLMRNLSVEVTGRATVVDENGNAIFVGPPWEIVGVHDREIVWHNSSSNETQIWFLKGHQLTRRATVVDENGNAIFVGLPWSIVGTIDEEIVWLNNSSNEAQIWVMNEHQVTGRATVVDENGNAAFVGPPWSIVGTDRFLRDPVPLPPGAPA